MVAVFYAEFSMVSRTPFVAGDGLGPIIQCKLQVVEPKQETPDPSSRGRWRTFRR
jgi:hypothetical protein